MIAYLEGQILLSGANLIVLKTSSGVGYAVHVSTQIAEKATPEEFLTLHIYTNVREDDLSLYGFENIEEKKTKKDKKRHKFRYMFLLSLYSFFSPGTIVMYRFLSGPR